MMELSEPWEEISQFRQEEFDRIDKRVQFSKEYRDQIKQIENDCNFPDFLDHVFTVGAVIKIYQQTGYKIDKLDTSRGAQLQVRARRLEFDHAANHIGCEWDDVNTIYRTAAQFIIDVKRDNQYDKLIGLVRGYYYGYEKAD